MSTFNGIVDEFPRIRIDYFRLDPSQPPPMACFLSHIHSDHLRGLESLKSPFVYCSAATRELLLRVEKYPHRMNLIKGILERRMKHYRNLKSVLKAVPLYCPTEIELGSRERIRVSLFDANHCPGAVMFLIEGDGKAILYTGDIRSEPWWVNSLVRNPTLLPYATGLRRLDRIYLDTTFALNENVYRDFPSKAEGIHELLEKVSNYPPDTVFYLSAWTLGYEEVWIAMSSFLNSKVHVDSYQAHLYASLSHLDQDSTSSDYNPLNGFQVGNHHQPGCLTNDSRVRIHSCEPGTPCHTSLLTLNGVVWITPIIKKARHGPVIREIGAGGGAGDLYQAPELDLVHIASPQQVEGLCNQIADPSINIALFRSMLQSICKSKDARMSLEGLDLDLDKVVSLPDFLSRLSTLDQGGSLTKRGLGMHQSASNAEPKGNTVHFPFARHSSYGELCGLIRAFNPTDIFPCTVDEDQWTEDVSIGALFGHLCSGSAFAHDEAMRTRLNQYLEDEFPRRKRRRKHDAEPSQESNYPNSPASIHSTHTGVEEQLQMPSLTTDSKREQELGNIVATKAISALPSSPSDHLAHIRLAYENRRQQKKDQCCPIPTHSGRSIDNISGEGSGGPASHCNDDSWKSVVPYVSHKEGEASPAPMSIMPDSASGVDKDIGLFYDEADGKTSAEMENQNITSTSNRLLGSSNRRDIRVEAYKAAKRTLETSDSGHWDDLGIKSIGNTGYSQPETEL